MEKKVFLLEGLDCANCAAKIEEKILKLSSVESASVDFATKKLYIQSNDMDRAFTEAKKIISQLEPDVKVIDTSSVADVVGHEHSGTCGCDVSEDEKVFKRVYDIKNLCCEICASAIEDKIRDIDSVQDVTVTFTTGKINITATRDPDDFLQEIRNACASVHHDVAMTDHANEHEHHHEHGHQVTNIFLGAGLFVIALIISHVFAENIFSILIYVAAYILLGYKVVISAVKNLFSGRIFDENFLMSVSTLGAFAIGSFSEAIAVMLFFQIGEYFEHRAVEKSRSSIMSVLKLKPEKVLLLDEHGHSREEHLHEVKVGDRIIVKVGDRVPLDATLLDGESQFDMSMVTGESVPIQVKKGETVFAGAVNLSGQVTLQVERLDEDSMISRVIQSVEHAAASKPTTVRFLTKFAKVYTPIVVLCAVLVAIVPSFLNIFSWYRSIYIALSFLVISCPCALVLSVPLAFFAGIGKASTEGMLFKGGNTIEALKDVKVIAMDKTGTLTNGKFAVTKISPTVSDISEDELLQLAASIESTSKHPLAQSVVQMARDKNLKLLSVSDAREIIGKGVEAKVEEKKVICGKRELMSTSDVQDVTEQGVNLFVEVEGEYLGYITLQDTLKDTVKDSMRKLKGKNLHTVVLTGDTLENTKNILGDVEIDEMQCKLMPSDKLTKVQEFREKYGPVLFVGDGVNDAPVLAGADVGAAMGSGVDASIEIADVVYMNSEVSSIDRSISLSKSICKVSRWNIAIALTVKILIMLLAVFGWASMWGAVIADTGVALVCILNSVRLNFKRRRLVSR